MKAVLVCTVSVLLLGATAPLSAQTADKPRLPARQPTESKSVEKQEKQPTEGETAEGTMRLGDVVEFTPPEGWDRAKNASTPTRAAFVSKDRQAMMSVELLPATMKIEKSFAADMMRKMRENRVKAKQKFVQEPTVEKDENYVLRIRERYEMKDKIADQLHLYRAVGPRFVMVTVNSLAGEEKAPEHHKIGEAASMSATLVKPAGK